MAKASLKMALFSAALPASGGCTITAHRLAQRAAAQRHNARISAAARQRRAIK
jgi:hypothetical protein